MATADVDDLADIFFGTQPAGDVRGTAATTATTATREHRRGVAGDLGGCDTLRHVATSGRAAALLSQPVAACRNPPNRPESEHWRGLSQMSQMSQAPDALPAAPPGAQSAQPCGDAAAGRFAARRARLIRWGWPQDEAQAMADRLARRDMSGDDRASCTECGAYRPGRCGNHRRAGLFSPEVGRDLAALLQRCPGFRP